MSVPQSKVAKILQAKCKADKELHGLIYENANFNLMEMADRKNADFLLSRSSLHVRLGLFQERAVDGGYSEPLGLFSKQHQTIDALLKRDKPFSAVAFVLRCAHDFSRNFEEPRESIKRKFETVTDDAAVRATQECETIAAMYRPVQRKKKQASKNPIIDQDDLIPLEHSQARWRPQQSDEDDIEEIDLTQEM